MSRTVDVLVVGGGPAGCRAAAAAAGEGASVLLVERKRRLGSLPHCAEYVPRALALEVEVPARARVQAVDGLETRLGEQRVFLAAPGWILDRQVFDFAQAEAAATAGAEVWAGATLTGRAGEAWLVRRGGETVRVNAGAVVAAAGAAPRLRRILGLEKQRLLAGVQVVVPLARPLERTLVWLEPRFSQGYAWLFPRGGSANLGLGCQPAAGPRELLAALHGELVAAGVVGPSVLALTSGAIPVSGPCLDAAPGVIPCGDAAGLTHAVTGAGIPQALFSGSAAGRAAAAMTGGDRSAPEAYRDEVWQRYRRYLGRGMEARERLALDWEGGDFSGLMAATWPGWGRGGA